MQLPIGISDFRKLIEEKNPSSGEGFLFVDKSLFIQEIVNSLTEVIILTRPRRFGKTINLSMLRHFYAAEVNGKPTAHLFSGLEISKYPACMAEQGKYPVIFISFKDAKYNDFASCYAHIARMMANLYREFKKLVYSHELANEIKNYFENILNERANIIDLDQSILWLTRLLYELTGQQCIVLIDEYDTPIQEAYLHGYYDTAIAFMKNLFGSSLKGNSYLKKAVLTGILRISKESLFSSLNNVKIYSVLDEKYAKYFGFTEEEVASLLMKTTLPTNTQQTKEWYNGYNFGGTTIFNPWSIIEFIAEQGQLMSYWVNTSGNEIIKDLIINAEPTIKEKLEVLMSGASLSEYVDEHIVFGDLTKNRAAVWSLLLMSGYLTIVAKQPRGNRYLCELVIPNKEIAYYYSSVVEDWLSGPRGPDWYLDFLNHLSHGRAIEFEENLQTLIEETLSYHDVTKKAQESFYHGLMLAFVSGLKDTHEIKSNKESGLGRYDVAIIPRDRNQVGVVLEFKAVATAAELPLAATEALEQIKRSRYIAELKTIGITDICQMGIAFCGKAVKVVAS